MEQPKGVKIVGAARLMRNLKVHNVRSRNVEKTAIKVMTCHNYAC